MAPIAPFAVDGVAMVMVDMVQKFGALQQIFWQNLAEALNVFIFVKNLKGAGELVQQEGERVESWFLASICGFVGCGGQEAFDGDLQRGLLLRLAQQGVEDLFAMFDAAG